MHLKKEIYHIVDVFKTLLHSTHSVFYSFLKKKKYDFDTFCYDCVFSFFSAKQSKKCKKWLKMRYF